MDAAQKLYLAIAERIDRLIDRTGLSHQDVADEVGVSDQTISRWRYGQGRKGPSLAEAVPLARRLGTTVEYLATGRQPAPAEVTADEMYLIQLVRDLRLERGEAARRLSGTLPDDFPLDAAGETDRPSRPQRRA